MARWVIGVVAGVCISSCASSGVLVPGYRVMPSAPVFPDTVWEVGSVRMEVRREAGDSLGAWMIRRAEALHASRATYGRDGDRPVEADVAIPEYWGHSATIYILPYGVDAYALEYFADRAVGDRTDPADGRVRGSSTAPTAPQAVKSELTYQAAVRTEADPAIEGSAYIVELRLTYRRCPLSFDKRRRVWFDRHGVVLAVGGDGETVPELSCL